MNYIVLLGYAAAVLTTLATLPQAIKTIKTKHTKDLSLGMYMLQTIGVFFWLVYGALNNDWPLAIANVFTFVLTGLVLIMKIKYG